MANSLSSQIVSHLVRIAQEAMSNVVRHAHARTCRVALHRRDGMVCLEVDDDGIGFDLNALEKPGLGLHHIDARARKFGGRSRIDSAPNRGTRIVVEIPPSR